MIFEEEAVDFASDPEVSLKIGFSVKKSLTCVHYFGSL